MSPRNSPVTDDSEREILITRVFDAPRDLVWQAWTDPRHIAQWWGPRGFTTRVTELDLRAGGAWRYVMTGPDGTEYPVKGVFREVVPPERIVTSDEFDEGFQAVSSADLPRGIVMTCIFDDVGRKTKLTLKVAHASAEERAKHEKMGVVGGWQSSFDCLDEFLATMQTKG
ncbi:MAG: SRPBCC domain-containing protein [Tepidisphaeraceae bacterium]